MIKKLINRIVWVLALLVTITVMIWANIKMANSNCSDIQVKLSNKNYPALITEEAIRTYILKNMPAVVGQSLNNIDLTAIEQQVALNSQLRDVRAFLGINGLVYVKAKPRQAIVRIFDNRGQNLYLGSGNVLMNSSINQSVRILVASGNIPYISDNMRNMVLNNDTTLPKIYNDLYDVAQEIHNDEFLDALIDQIYVDKNQELEFTPKVGVKKIYFGTIDNMEEKFMNLKAFYINGKTIVDWQKYQSINVKFRNQIVCSKK